VRRAIVVGNWKMHETGREARELARATVAAVRGALAEVVLCPPFTALAAVREVLDGSPVGLGAQDVHWEREGAWTGEISSAMLRDAGCSHVIVGHSERRLGFGETDERVALKTRAALGAGLCPIVCIGETLAERERGTTEHVLATQLAGAFGGLRSELAGVIVAYEPVWAIGTGRMASPGEAQAAHAFIRHELARLAGASAAEAVRIQYGGSIRPSNAAELLAQPDVDGGLVGGASLEAAQFGAIVHAAR
jgi:triosephosphate isomerase